MHPQSPALTIGGTVLKESDDLVILGGTFDSKMTYEKHLRLVSVAASGQLDILKTLKTGSLGKYSMIDCFLGDAFGVLSWPFWSTVLPCGALRPIHILNYRTI